MSYLHPAALAARRKYWTRHDEWRFAAPGTPEAKMPGWLDPSATRVRMEEAKEDEARAREAAEQEAFERKLLELRWLVKSLRTDLLLLGLRHKYSPNQPRDELGRWTSGASRVGDAAAAGAQSASSGGLTDLSAARKTPPIVKEFGKWTARQYVSRYCEARVNRELPGEFENMTIEDIWNIAKGGGARARNSCGHASENDRRNWHAKGRFGTDAGFPGSPAREKDLVFHQPVLGGGVDGDVYACWCSG
jgi:hypothetical protein